MKGLVAILLCALLSMPWATKLSITIDFFVHQDYIATNLCENREKPELNCNGQCILMQKLQVLEESESQPKPLPEILAFDLSSFIFCEKELSTKSICTNEYKRYISVTETFPESVYLGNLFEPPQVIA